MRARHLRCSAVRYKATSQPDLKGHCRATIAARERERAVLGKGANKMKNSSKALKRQGQKSFPPAACYSDMTNKSPSHHQSPGIKLETHTIDSDAFAPQEKLGVDTDADPSRMQRSNTLKGKTHGSTHSAYIRPFFH